LEKKTANKVKKTKLAKSNWNQTAEVKCHLKSLSKKEYSLHQADLEALSNRK